MWYFGIHLLGATLPKAGPTCLRGGANPPAETLALSYPDLCSLIQSQSINYTPIRLQLDIIGISAGGVHTKLKCSSTAIYVRDIQHCCCLRPPKAKPAGADVTKSDRLKMHRTSSALRLGSQNPRHFLRPCGQAHACSRLLSTGRSCIGHCRGKKKAWSRNQCCLQDGEVQRPYLAFLSQPGMGRKTELERPPSLLSPHWNRI